MNSIILIIFLTFAPIINLLAEYISAASFDDAENFDLPSRRRIYNQRKINQYNLMSSRKFDWTMKEDCYLDEDSHDECRLLENGTTCFGASLPYSLTSTRYLEKLNLLEMHEHLERWQVYSGLPECWGHLRDLLCALFYPPCKDGRVLRIQRSMCVEAREKCGFLVRNYLWPNALGDCIFSNVTQSNVLESIFTTECKMPRFINWHSNSTCSHPLALTNLKEDLIVDKCALNCTAMRIDRSEPIQTLLMFGLSAILVFTILTAILLRTEHRNMKHRTPYFLPLFHFSICQIAFIACWLVQMSTGAPTTCRDDGSLRLGEPKRYAPLYASVTCLIQYMVLFGTPVTSSFLIVLFSAMHCHWRRRPVKCMKWGYAFIGVWFMAIIVISGGLGAYKVDGDPVLSVCFISRRSFGSVLFYVVPVLFSCICTIICLIGAVLVAMKQESKHPDDAAADATHDLVDASSPTVTQICFLQVFLVLCYLTSASLVFTDVFRFHSQKRDIVDYVNCQLRHTIDQPAECELQKAGDIRMAQFGVFVMCLPALIVDVWLFVCVDFRRRLFKLCSRRKADATTNGNAVMLTATTGVNAMDNRNRADLNRHRKSWGWSSTSSMTDPGVVSDPETRIGKQREFINRFNRRRPNVRDHHNSKSLNSLALSSVITPSSLRSGSLPSSVQAASPLNELPFPDLNNYPMVQASAGKNWWNPYAWPYLPWWCYYPPQSTASGAASAQLNQSSPSAFMGGVSAPDHHQLATGTAENPTPSTSTPNAELIAQQLGASSALPPPFYWPYPIPPYSPYWTQSTAPFSTPDQQLTIGPGAATSPTPTDASKTNPPEENETSKEVAQDEMDVGEPISENPDEKISEQDEDDVENSDDDDDVNSEESDPEEERFVEEQLRLLLGRNESQ